MTHRSSYLAGFHAARQMIEAYARERARLCEETASKYATMSYLPAGLVPSERGAADEATHLALFAKQLTAPPARRKRLASSQDAARESA